MALRPNNENYRVVFPEGWTINAIPGKQWLVGVSPLTDEHDTSRENIIIAMEQLDEPMTVHEYLHYHTGVIQQALNVVQMEPIADTTLGGEPAAMLEFTHTVRAAPPIDPAHLDEHDHDHGHHHHAPADSDDAAERPTQVMRAWVIAMVHEDRYFAIICTGADESFEKDRLTFQRVLDSFELKPPGMRRRR